MPNETSAIRTAYFSILSNFLLAGIKGTAGFFGNSYALIADAIESTTDVFASVLVLMGLTYAQKPADKNHPYGHGKIEPLVTFIVVAFLVVSAGIIVHESIQNIRSPQKSPESWTLFILAAIILWKEFSYRVVIKKSRQTGSSALRADAWHHRSDAITSVLAFVGISIAVLFGEGYETADDWAAIFAAGFILYNSYLIFRPALGEVMDEHRYDDLVDRVRRESLEVPGILGTEKCFVRKAGMRYHLDLHARVDGEISVREGHDLAHRLKDHLNSQIPGLGHVLIHIEPCERPAEPKTTPVDPSGNSPKELK
jgi:cation diffusion facilitator family transporter